MCGIVGAVAQRNVSAILIEGLHRLEYRGYDSAGLSIITGDAQLQTLKSAGKVAKLEAEVKKKQLTGHTGIAHTRWATHGKPNTKNSHLIIPAQPLWYIMALLKTMMHCDRN